LSGPKYSRPRLTAAELRRQEEARKRRIEQERRRQEEKLRKEIESKIEKDLLKLTEIKQSIEIAGINVLVEASEILGEDHIIDRINKEKQRFLSKISKLPRNFKGQTIANVQNYHKNLTILVSDSRDFDKNSLQIMLNELENIVKYQKVINSERDFLERTQSLEVKKQGGIDLSLGENEKEQQGEIELAEVINHFNEVLLPYVESQYLTSAKKEELTKFYTGTMDLNSNEKFDKKYIMTQVYQRLKAFLTTKTKYDREIECLKQYESEFLSLSLTYQSLSEMLHIEFSERTFSIENAEAQIKSFKDEISLLGKQLSEKEENEYIANSVNEIMSALGYEVVSSEIMQTPKRQIVQQLYDFGENSVINVSTSNDGSLLFQVNGVSNGKKTEVTSLEKLKVMENMDLFCGKYPFIKEELLKKGIELTNEDLKPTDEKYVSFIDITKRNIVNRKHSRQLINQNNQVKAKSFEQS
jgi:hypothetical protein